MGQMNQMSHKASSDQSKEVEGVNIESSWKEALNNEFQAPYFSTLRRFIKEEYLSGKNIYPAPKHIFKALDICPVDRVKVVILGQDPYHGPSQANGLSFAVQSGTPLPPSLKNIFKEIQDDLCVEPLSDGDLSRWAKQGVLLLNATLTVEASKSGSHQGRGWEQFTDAIIKHLSSTREHLVFMLWGNYAKQKGVHIDRSKHLVLEAAHPSPFSAHQGFFGCKHFSQANEYLRKLGLSEVDWR